MSAQYADNERKMREDLHLSDTNNKYMSIQLQKELSALRNRLLQQEKSVTHRECQLMKAKGDRELSKFPGERLKRVTEIDRLTKRKVCLKEFLMTIDRMQVIDSSIICGRLKSALDSLKYITRRHEDAVSSSSNFEVRRIRNSNEFQKKILERNKVRINQRISERELEIGAVSDALQTTSGILEDVKRECKRSEEAYAEKEALAATQTIEAQTQRYKKETSDAELFITRATTMLDALSLVLSKLTAYELSDGSEKEEDDVPVDIDLDISELIANSERSRPTESLPQRARLRGKRPGAPQSLRAPPRSKLSESLKSSEVRKVRESPVAVARPEGVKKHQTRRSLGGTVSGRSDIAVPHKGYESAAVRTSPYEDQSERKRDGDGSCVLRSMTTPFRASLIPATRSYTQLEEVIQMAALKDSELLRRREDDEEELMIPTSGSFRRIPRKEGDVTPKKSVQQELNLPVRRTPPRELELIRKRTDIDLGLSLPARRDLRRELELTPKRKHIDEDLNSAQKTKGEDSPSSVPKENLTYVKELSTPVKEKVIDEDVQGLREAGSWFLDWPGPLKKFDELVSVSSPKISTASGHPSSSKASPVDRKSIRNHGEMETQLPVPGISRHFDVAFIPRHPHEPSMPRAVNRGGIAPFSTSKIGIEEVKQVGLEGLVFVKHIGISAGGTGPNDAGTFGDITAQHSVDFDDGVCEVREPAEETARMSRRNVRPESLRENRHEEGNMGWNRYYYLTRDQSAFGDLQLGKDYVTGLSKARRAKSKKVVTGAQRRVNRDMVPLRVSFDAQGVPTSGAHDMWMWSRRTRDEWKTKRLTSKGKVRVQKRAVSCRTNRS
jgi:hypothetical protein